MAGWLDRWQKRQIELAEGADADLVQANRRKSRTAFGLVALAVLLVLTSAKTQLPHKLDLVLRIIAMISFSVGLVLAKWAAAEHAFLTKPEPEEPPGILSEKR